MFLKSKQIVNLFKTAAILAVMAISIIPAFSAKAGGLSTCGSDSAEYSAAQQVNSSGGTGASLDQFTSVSCQISNLIPQINHIINYLISVAGLYFVIRIIWLGSKMVFFASSPDAAKEAKKDMVNALFGFIIVMVAFILVNTIYAVLQININGATGFQFNPFGS